ncbi:MAG: DUF2721 domain-containing protein [Verrucomicrobiota bacterium]
MPLRTFATVSIPEILSSSTAPVILISGIGLLLLVISNRIVHVSDRLRSIMQSSYSPERERQVDVLHHRAKILRGSIIALCTSIFTSGVLLVVNVINELHVIEAASGVIASLLILSTLSIAVASGGLLHDVVLSLRAIEVEIKQYVSQRNDSTVSKN